MAPASILKWPTGRLATPMVRHGGVTTAADPTSSWKALLQRIADGDDNALSSLYDESSALVYGLIRRIVRDEADAEDLTAEVYARIWARARSFDGKLGAPAAWILTIARNRAVDRLRRRRREGRSVPIDEAGELESPENLEARVGEEEQGARLRQALARLSSEQRHVLELAFFRGLSHTDIAHRLGLPVGTVKTRIRLGMNRLRTALGGRQGGDHEEAEGA